MKGDNAWHLIEKIVFLLIIIRAIIPLSTVLMYITL